MIAIDTKNGDFCGGKHLCFPGIALNPCYEKEDSFWVSLLSLCFVVEMSDIAQHRLSLLTSIELILILNCSLLNMQRKVHS